jgi:hypothetical protein
MAFFNDWLPTRAGACYLAKTLLPALLRRTGVLTPVRMLRKAIALLLIGSLTLDCMGRLGILAYFTINQDYIARVLCLNKAKPEMGCKGKCFLAKQLKAQEEQERKAGVPKRQFEEIVLFLNLSLPLLYCPWKGFLTLGSPAT